MANFTLPMPAENSTLHKFMALFNTYSMNPKTKGEEIELSQSFNPRKWHTPLEFMAMLRTIRGYFEHHYDVDKTEISKREDLKPQEKTERLKEITATKLDHLKKLRDMIPGMLTEYRKSRDEALEKFSPEEKSNLTKIKKQISEEEAKEDPDLDVVEKLKSDYEKELGAIAKEFKWLDHSDIYVPEFQDILMSESELNHEKSMKDQIVEEKSKEKPDEEKIKVLQKKHDQGLVLEKRETKKDEGTKQKGWKMFSKDKFIAIGHEMNSIKKDAEHLRQTLEKLAKIDWIGSIHKPLEPKLSYDLIGRPTPKQSYDLIEKRAWHYDESEKKHVRDPWDTEEKRYPSGFKTEEENVFKGFVWKNKEQSAGPAKEREKTREELAEAFWGTLKWTETKVKDLTTEQKESLSPEQLKILEEKEKTRKDLEISQKELKEKFKEEGLELQHHKMTFLPGEDLRKYGIPVEHDPVHATSVISHDLEWFKKLSSMYHIAYWMHEKTQTVSLQEMHNKILPKAPVEEKPSEKKAAEITLDYLGEEQSRTKASLHDYIDKLDDFVRLGIKSVNTRSIADKAIKAGHTFSRAMTSFMNDHFQYVKRTNPSSLKSPAPISEKEPVKAAEMSDDLTVKDFDAFFKKEEVLAKIKTIKDKALVNLATSELEDIYKELKKYYVSPPENIKKDALKDKVSPQEFIRKHTPALLSVFVDNWTKPVEDIEKKKESDWTEKYVPLDNLVKTLQSKKIFPELAQFKIETVSKARASTEAVLKYIKEVWTMPKLPEGASDFEKDVRRDYLNEMKEFGKIHGGAGASSSGREKKHDPIVSGMQEIMTDRILKFLQGKKTPKEYLSDYLHNIGHGLWQHVDEKKEILDKGTVYRQMLDDFKNMAFSVKIISVDYIGVKGERFESPMPSLMPKVKEMGELTKDRPEEEKKASMLYRVLEATKPLAPGGKEPKAPQLAPGGEKEPSSQPFNKILVQPGPVKDRPGRADIIMSRPEEARELEKKITEFHDLLEKYSEPGKIQNMIPDGLDRALRQINKEKGEGAYDPSREKARQEGLKKTEEDWKRNPTKEKDRLEEEKYKKKLEKLKKGSLLAFRVASNFIEN